MRQSVVKLQHEEVNYGWQQGSNKPGEKEERDAEHTDKTRKSVAVDILGTQIKDDHRAWLSHIFIIPW